MVLNLITGRGETLPTFVRAVDYFDEQFGNRIECICKKVTEIENCINYIASSMFSDEKINHGRILALFSFSRYLGNQFPSHKEQIASETGKFVSKHLLHWINTNGGWYNF